MRSIVARNSHFSMEFCPALWFVTPVVRVVNELDRCRHSNSRARSWIILSVHSPFSKVRIWYRVALRFSERDGSRNGRRGEATARLRVRFSYFALWPRGNLGCVCCACDMRERACGCTGAYPHCYGYISGCLSCKKGLGSSPYVYVCIYLRGTTAISRLFYPSFA